MKSDVGEGRSDVKSEGWRVRGVIEGGSVKSDGGRGRGCKSDGAIRMDVFGTQ